MVVAFLTILSSESEGVTLCTTMWAITKQHLSQNHHRLTICQRWLSSASRVCAGCPVIVSS